MDFALVVGSRLLRSHELTRDDEEVRNSLSQRPIDGALVLVVDDHVVVDEHLWDRLDELISQLRQILNQLERSVPPGQINFPDTRVVLTFRVHEDRVLQIAHDADSVECPVDDFTAAGHRVLAAYEDLLEKNYAADSP